MVDQPTDRRSEWWASTPMASRTGDGSSDSEAHELPEWAATPARSSAISTAWGSTSADAQTHQVGEALGGVAVEHNAFGG